MKNMTYRRRLLLAAAFMAGFGVTAIGVGTTFAAGRTAQTGINHLVEAIATRFNISVSDVQAVFDEERSVMEVDREAREAERLVEAVTAGKITQAQADLLTAKRAEMEAFMETLKDLTPEERKSAMKTHMEEMKTWAEEQGIPEGFFMGGPKEGMRGGPEHGRGGRGFGGMRGEGNAPSASVSHP